MNPDAVYELLVDANPVPDPHAASSAERALDASRHQGSEPMLTLEPETGQTPPDQSRRRWLMAAAAAVIVIVAAALILTREGGEPVEPATTTPDVTEPAPTGADAAAATAAAFYRAVIAGDVDRVLAMSNPDFTDLEADRQMWEMNAVAATAGEPWTIGACVPASEGNTLYIVVRCEVTIHDPVFEALGVADVIAPVRVFDDLTAQWQPFEGADFGDANRAYADYLREFHPAEYDAVCDPAAYEPGSIVADNGLALTGECAELWAPLADDVAEWVVDQAAP